MFVVLHESSAGAPRRVTFPPIKLFQNTALGLFLSLLVWHLVVRMVRVPPQDQGSQRGAGTVPYRLPFAYTVS